MTIESFQFRGKYASMAKSLASPDQNSICIFKNYYQLYICSAMFGLLNNRKISFNPSTDNEDVEPVTIRNEVFNRGRDVLDYDNVRHMIVLSEPSSDNTFEQKIERALKYDIPVSEESVEAVKNKSTYSLNTELFNEYVLGGLTLLYEKFGDKKNEDLILALIESKNEIQNAKKK